MLEADFLSIKMTSNGKKFSSLICLHLDFINFRFRIFYNCICFVERILVLIHMWDMGDIINYMSSQMFTTLNYSWRMFFFSLFLLLLPLPAVTLDNLEGLDFPGKCHRWPAQFPEANGQLLLYVFNILSPVYQSLWDCYLSRIYFVRPPQKNFCFQITTKKHYKHCWSAWHVKKTNKKILLLLIR